MQTLRTFCGTVFLCQVSAIISVFVFFCWKTAVRRRDSYGSLGAYDYRRPDSNIGPLTACTIETNESTPLLADQGHYGSYNNDARSGLSMPLFKAYEGEGPTASTTATAKVQLFVCRLMAIGFLSVGGLSIATYLLIIESRVPNIVFSLDLISREVWSGSSGSLGNTLQHGNVSNVVILQTGGESCEMPESCLRVLREMQKQAGDHITELPFNFLIGGDGQTYEVRGWDHESGLQAVPQQSSLVVGFIGEFTKSSPSRVQVRSARSLIRESARRHKLQSPFRILGLWNSTGGGVAGEQLLADLAKWAKSEKLLRIV